MFLRNERTDLRAELSRRIDAAAEILDFETAARSRDILQNVETFWANPRWQVWIDDTVDTYTVDEIEGEMTIFLASHRRRRLMGKHIFANVDADRTEDALTGILSGMYIFNAPREIRIPFDLPGRHKLAEGLSQQFGRPVTIKITHNNLLSVTAIRAFKRSREEVELRQTTGPESVKEIEKRLRPLAGTTNIPEKIAAFDVAHISATTFVAASVTRDLRDNAGPKYDYDLSAETSEPSAFKAFIASRIRSDLNDLPDLLLVDGGPAQLHAAIEGVSGFADRQFRIVAAVKPAGKHFAISHFLTETGGRIEYDANDPAHKFLLTLRDEAHELANSIHRLSRDMAPFYELAVSLPSLNEAQRQILLKKFGSIRRIKELGETEFLELFDASAAVLAVQDLTRSREHTGPAQPLIVPIRYDERGGEAEDLRPILTNEPAMKM
jgi:excinuclease ABC subunit C